MATIAIIATLLSAGLYLGLGFFLGRKTRTLSDHLPIMANVGKAHVHSTSEFSACTVATTISLATVVLAFFELAPYFGLWLLWPVLTTALGLIVARLFARRIWQRMSVYGANRPTLHGFLAKEYDSQALGKIAATCTSLGFLGAFAVELTVGSKFLGSLIPQIPVWVTVVGLALVGLTYTAVGGFRVVVVTDRVQMWSIWVLLCALGIAYQLYADETGGWSNTLDKLPVEIKNLSWREGLGPFLLGIFVINVPTFVSDMSVWQRIAGSRKMGTVFRGLWRSVGGAATTWTLLVFFACLVPAVTATAASDVNPLIALLRAFHDSIIPIKSFLMFVIVFGLFGAMFSTASTQLIALSHTVQMDLFGVIARNEEVEHGNKDVKFSRIIITVAAIAAMIIVGGLTALGFSIADLVFAIYGAQLGLFPPVALALLAHNDWKRRFKSGCVVAVSVGFVVGWGLAIGGKVFGNDNLVFLAPVGSLVASSIALVALPMFFKSSTTNK